MLSRTAAIAKVQEMLAMGRALPEIGQSQACRTSKFVAACQSQVGVRTKGQPFACPGLVDIHFFSPAVFGARQIEIKEAPVMHCCLGDATAYVRLFVMYRHLRLRAIVAV